MFLKILNLTKSSKTSIVHRSTLKKRKIATEHKRQVIGKDDAMKTRIILQKRQNLQNALICILGIAISINVWYIIGDKIPAMFVMVLYFEPQILYGMTRPTKCSDVKPHQLVEDRYCTAVFTHPAIRRVYKMASHGGAGRSRGKQSLNRATVFLSFTKRLSALRRKQ